MAEGTYVVNGGVEPWRCGHCGELIYRVILNSRNGYPAQRDFPRVLDAPMHHGFYAEYGPVCRTCKDLVSVLEEGVEAGDSKIPDAAIREKFKAAHKEWVEQLEKDRKLAKRLRPGDNYLEQ